MTSLWSRLLGALAEQPEPKAAVGVGATMLTYDVPIHSALPRQQQKLMSEAQALYHRNPWVAAAERAIVGRIVRTPWHLEQDDGDTVGDDAPSGEQAVLELLRKPAPNLTARQLWSVTLRHLGLCGNAFWYLDQTERLAGTPLQVLYINPVRMDEVLDSDGNLLGWLLDSPTNPVSGRPGNEATPLQVDEVMHFTLDPPDSGVWGIGVAEAVAANIELSRLATQHAAKTLAAGGRLAGILMPGAQTPTLSDDQWAQIQREYRNVTNDPDSAKRLQILKVPMEFQQTSSTAEQLQLAALMEVGRDDVLNAWGVPLTTIGIPTPRGLNSGEQGKYDEAALWQGPIEHRLQPFAETLQQRLIDRFQGLGIDVTLVLDSPKFDDQTPLFDLAVKAINLPLTMDQRRALVGEDPLDPKIYGDLGSQIWLTSQMGPLGGPSAATPPASTTSPQGAPIAAKASRAGYKGLRSGVERTFVPVIRRAVAALLAEQKADIISRIRAHGDQLARKPKDSSVWWDGPKWRARLRQLLTPEYSALALHVSGRIIRDLKAPAKADDFLDQLLNRIWTKGGQRIVGITDTTRDEVRDFIAAGVSEGKGWSVIADELEDASMFNAARADLIARTETMLAYNSAALGSYDQLGVQEVEAIDGDQDEECASRDGQTFSVDEADGIQDHPNGTLDWIPLASSIVEGKADVRDPELMALLKAALSREPTSPVSIHLPPEMAVAVQAPSVNNVINVPEQPTPSVTVNVPEQPPAQVNVEAPIVNVPAPPKADGPSQVEVVSMPRRVHRALRDKAGTIQGSDEVDA